MIPYGYGTILAPEKVLTRKKHNDKHRIPLMFMLQKIVLFLWIKTICAHKHCCAQTPTIHMMMINIAKGVGTAKYLLKRTGANKKPLA